MCSGAQQWLTNVCAVMLQTTCTADTMSKKIQKTPKNPAKTATTKKKNSPWANVMFPQWMLHA